MTPAPSLTAPDTGMRGRECSRTPIAGIFRFNCTISHANPGRWLDRTHPTLRLQPTSDRLYLSLSLWVVPPGQDNARPVLAVLEGQIYDHLLVSGVERQKGS